MANFGLDKKFISELKNFSVEHVRADQSSDFFILPQLDLIYKFCAEDLIKSISAKLGNSSYGPKSPIEMEIPKSSRVLSKTISVKAPNYFRPGTILLPEDRILFHFIASKASPMVEAALDRASVFSQVPTNPPGSGFEPASKQWDSLKGEFEKSVKSGEFKVALKSDISQYFNSINQHELVNQLEHQKLAPELVKLAEKFLAGLTVDRSSRGLPQGVFGSDLLGNSYLAGIDEFISDYGLKFYRYVDDIYILFKSSDQFREFFPKYVKKLREYDLSLNENKTFFTAPLKLLREETELDKAIEAAKAEAAEKLTDYEVIVTEDGPYGDTVEDVLEIPPDDEEVDLEATKEVFEKIDDFTGEERHRAESFCLSFFRLANDPIAIPYVAKNWARHPDRARDYAMYLNRFCADKKHVPVIDEMIRNSAATMIDYQWAWAAIIMRRMNTVSTDLLNVAYDIFKNQSNHDVVRSLLVYTICQNGTAARKKEVRESFNSNPLLIQLSIIHCGDNYTAGERNSLMSAAQAYGELHSLMCDAYKASKKAAS